MNPNRPSAVVHQPDSIRYGQCPSCASSDVRYGTTVSRQFVRSILGSRKRCCRLCGRRWLAASRSAPVEPLPIRELAQTLRRWVAPGGVSIVLLAIAYVAWAIVKASQASAQMYAHPGKPYHYVFLHARNPNSPAATYRIPLPILRAPRVSSRFGYRYHPILNRGRFHYGIDLPMRTGTPVFPARDGKVIAAGPAGDYGKRVVVLHPDGQSSLYGHLSVIRAKVGDQVLVGASIIGEVGSTGLSTGPHLHFEIRNGKGLPINPDTVLGL